MKLYRADLISVNSGISYFQKELYEEMGVYGVWVEYYIKNGIYNEEYHYSDDAINYVSKLVVYRNFGGNVTDVITGRKFPTVKILTDIGKIRMPNGKFTDTKYHFSKTNQRLYVLLGQKLLTGEVKQFFERLDKQTIENNDKNLQSIIEQEQQHWNPFPKSTKQYVKMIEQMRKDI